MSADVLFQVESGEGRRVSSDKGTAQRDALGPELLACLQERV